jgi:Mg2+ and Co2+ transporter CorA
MKTSWYVLDSGRLQLRSLPPGWSLSDLGQPGESWLDIEEANPEELAQLLAPFNFHPLLLKRCQDEANDPGVMVFDKAILLEFPVGLDPNAENPAYLTMVFQSPVLVTIHHGSMITFSELVESLDGDKDAGLHHLPQLVYQIIDHLADLTVEAEIEVRNQILHMGEIMTKNPAAVSASDLMRLRWQVDKLVSLIENQLYCVAGLNASDHEALREPHRKAYIQDLVSEGEIAQKSIYRLEGRVNDLYNYYQMASNDRVERRLRILTIVSAITLPLGLISGLLGMNVGGVPGTTVSYGFIVVIALMVIIAVVELWYFRSKGWFE